MSILKICQYGEAVLREVAKPLKKEEIKTEETQELIFSMLETMYEHQGVGLAAPQVGVSKRIITIDTDWQSGKENPLILINPEFLKTEGEIQSEEGCLSFNGNTSQKSGVQLSEIKRFASIKVVFYDQRRKRKELQVGETESLLLRCIQHEIDHLNGVLFIDRNLDREQTNKQLTKNGFNFKSE